MNNEKGGQNQGQNQNRPTDKGEDAEDRREAAERVWKDRAGVPRGTPEQGRPSPDRVGGTGTQRQGQQIDEESDDSSNTNTKKDS
jgi:hypothetical protein